MFWQVIAGDLKSQMFEERLRHFNIPVRHPAEQPRHCNFKYYSFKNKDRLNVQYIVFEIEQDFRADTVEQPTKKRELSLV